MSALWFGIGYVVGSIVTLVTVCVLAGRQR